MKDQFDLFEGERQKKIGMTLAADNKKDLLLTAKKIAMHLARLNGSVTIDDVQKELFKIGADIGMAAGSIFRGKEWIRIGHKKTERSSSHARLVSIWKIK